MLRRSYRIANVMTIAIPVSDALHAAIGLGGFTAGNSVFARAGCKLTAN